MDWKLLPLSKTVNVTGLYSFFYYERDTHFYFPGEKHDFWEMVYVDRGEISAVADTRSYLLRQGELLFHKPNEFHAMASSPREPHNVIVTSFATDSVAMEFFKNKLFTLTKQQQGLLSQMFGAMRAAFGNGFAINTNAVDTPVVNMSAYQLAIAHLEHLLIDLMGENRVSLPNERERQVARKNVENALVDAVKAFLKSNVYRRLNLQTVCEQFHLSKSYLCDAFRSETGQSLMNFYMELKIQEAKFLIRKGEWNFTQIAEALGFADIHHFSHAFKNKAGMSPSAYAKTV